MMPWFKVASFQIRPGRQGVRCPRRPGRVRGLRELTRADRSDPRFDGILVGEDGAASTAEAVQLSELRSLLERHLTAPTFSQLPHGALDDLEEAVQFGQLYG